MVDGMNRQRLECRDDKGITGQHCNTLAKLCVYRWFAAALYGVVEAW
tara:strand:+ start:37 stop:177 length:141 start_codon:yes stop_codon:yes gene_type:complete